MTIFVFVVFMFPVDTKEPKTQERNANILFCSNIFDVWLRNELKEFSSNHFPRFVLHFGSGNITQVTFSEQSNSDRSRSERLPPRSCVRWFHLTAELKFYGNKLKICALEKKRKKRKRKEPATAKEKENEKQRAANVKVAKFITSCPFLLFFVSKNKAQRQLQLELCATVYWLAQRPNRNAQTDSLLSLRSSAEAPTARTSCRDCIFLIINRRLVCALRSLFILILHIWCSARGRSARQWEKMPQNSVKVRVRQLRKLSN